MKMKRYIAAGILATALLASGCGKFVRDELITMQNEIDQLSLKVAQMINNDLATLSSLVHQMENGGYIVERESFTDEEGRSGISLKFNNGEILKLYHGTDGINGEDAVAPTIIPRWDEESGHYYWAVKQASEEEFTWLLDEHENRVQAGAVDGFTPKVKIEDGVWWLSWDGSDENWVATDWPAKGADAVEVFSKVDVFDDRIEVTLASDGSVLVLPRYLPVDMELTLEGQDLSGEVLIAPGETLAIKYALTGTGAENALLVAGTDGRFKTALKPLDPEAPSTTEGIVEVTCPATFPEGGYIYITVNDGNGHSQAQVIRFVQRACQVTAGELNHAVATEGETGYKVVFDSNFEVEVIPPVFPEGEEAWVKVEFDPESKTITCDVLPNTDKERSAFIQVCPKDHPGFEMFRITVTQAGVPATGTGEGEGA